MRLAINHIIPLMACILIAASCSDRYELKLNLSVSRNEIKVDKTEGKTHFIVYSTGSWEISGESSWASLSTDSGKGRTQVDVSYEANTGLSRQSVFTLTGKGLSVDVILSQKAGFADDVAYNFSSPNVTITRAANRITAPLSTNIPEEHLKNMTFSVLYSEDNSEEWLSGITYSDGAVIIDAADNGTGLDRIASVTATVPVAYWDTAPQTSIWISQSASAMSLGYVPAEVQADPDGVQPVTVTLSPPFSTAEFDYTIGYTLESVPWLSDVSFVDNVFSARASVNYGEVRQASLTFFLTYEGTERDRATVTIIQQHTTAGNGQGGTPDETVKDDPETF